jgi:hypothetical protein
MSNSNLPVDLALLLKRFKNYCARRGFSNIKTIDIDGTGLDSQNGVVTTGYTIFLINQSFRLKYISGTDFSDYDSVLATFCAN